MFTVPEQEEIATFASNAEFEVIHSHEGHDGFLLEFDIMNKLIKSFVSRRSDQSIFMPSPSSSALIGGIATTEIDEDQTVKNNVPVNSVFGEAEDLMLW